MNKSIERIGKFVAIGLATGIGVTACGGNEASTAPRTTCTGLEFVSPKGGPGMIQMDVYPRFNRNFGDARSTTVTGEVISGNDTGTPVSTPHEANGFGAFTFTWDTRSNDVQSSEVDVNAQFDGNKYTCPDTTLYFNPVNYQIKPHLADSPY